MSRRVPYFGVRKFARGLIAELEEAERERDGALETLRTTGALSLLEIQQRVADAERTRAERQEHIDRLQLQLKALKQEIVVTEDTALLQEAGVYSYFHPLSDAVAYKSKLASLQDEIKSMNRTDGGAVLAATEWTVNGSAAAGRKMVREISKLMLRAFNAEADNLVRGLKPYKVKRAIERLEKVAGVIEKLGKTMNIRISSEYRKVRIRELCLTSDFLQKAAEEKEQERIERERLREERKVKREMERERAKLEKERGHYLNALSALEAKGDYEGASRLRAQLLDVEKAIEDVDYRTANIRAGYVYVISNIGSFGDSIVKIGMTRRLDPLDRIKELSDASVPFNFDVHALFFSNDAVGIESAMHERLANCRCNLVNLRREFFRATPQEVKDHLLALTGELLTFQDDAEALEFRQSKTQREAAEAVA